MIWLVLVVCFFSTPRRGDVAQWLMCRDSNLSTLHSIPWWGRVRNIFFVPPSQLLCKLLCAWPPFVCAARTLICVHVKEPISICGKRASQLVIWKHKNTAHRKKQKSWVAPYCGCSLSPGKAAQMSHALHWDKKTYLIWWNLILSSISSVITECKWIILSSTGIHWLQPYWMVCVPLATGIFVWNWTQPIEDFGLVCIGFWFAWR